MNLKAAENLRLRHHFVLIRFSQDDQGCFGFRIAVHLLISWFLFQSLTVNAQNYIEIAGNIDTIYYRSGDTNDLENSIHRIFSFACIIGTNQHNQQWQINNNFTEGSEEKWFFDGTNVLTGRALADDVIDTELILIFGGPTGASNAGLTSDHVDANDKAFTASFPYLATAW